MGENDEKPINERGKYYFCAFFEGWKCGMFCCLAFFDLGGGVAIIRLMASSKLIAYIRSLGLLSAY